MMTAFDLQRIVAQTCAAQVEYRDEVGSTNDLALEIVARQPPACPLLVLADRQHAGRGRGANRWWSSLGALTFTWVLDTRSSSLLIRDWPRVSLAAALAVCDALNELLPGVAVRLKWPNDVYLQSRKVCGILVESSPARAGVLLLGIGVNVNNMLAQAPVELQMTATSLRDVAGRSFDRTDLLIRILDFLGNRLQQLEERSLQLSDSWSQLCLLQGRTVCLESGSQRTVGVCHGIDDEGALLLHTEAGIQRCFAGVVTKVL